MKKTVLLSLLFSTLLLSFEDYDLDGVEDIFDDCPNTPITDLVDINGCTIHSLVKSYNYDAIFGITQATADYNGTNESILTTLQVDYYYNDFSFQLSSAYISSNSTLADTYISSYYNYNNNDVDIRFGIALILPTSTIEGTNKTDYMTSANISYKFFLFNAFAGLSTTFINDTSSDQSITYKNSSAYTLGVGFYPTEELYSSISYNMSESIYVDGKDSTNLSWYTFYTINKEWFTTLNYDYGLNTNLNSSSLSFKVGYYF